MGKRLTREEFDALVWRVEKRYLQRSAALRARLAWLVVLGYGGLLSALLGALLLVSLFGLAMISADGEGRVLMGIMAVVILAASLWGTMRVLLVRSPPPEGHVVSRAEAPALHALLDELRSSIRSA